MLKVSLRTNQQGISVVEILLAVAVFGMLVTALSGALIYGRTATNTAGNRQRANMIAEEGIEAVRNIRDASFSNLTDGTFGVSKNSNQWITSGSSDTTDIFTRQVTIASADSKRKTITSTVSWPQGNGTNQTSVTTELTNWMASIVKTWAKPALEGGSDATGTTAGFKVATQGNYAYLVKKVSGSANFFIFDISTPTSPTLVKSLTIAGTPTNIAVNGNYAYVSNTSDTAELNIVNVTTPATASVVGNYNATGTGDGLGVFALGNYAYLSRAANGASDEFVIVNVTTPATPTRAGGYSLNISMYEPYVNSTGAYIATSSDTQEVLVLNLTLLSTITLGTSINLPGTTDATTIAGSGSNIVVGQGTAFYDVNSAVILVPVVSGTVTLPSTINDVAINTSLNYAYAATANTTGQFQSIDISTWTAPAISGSTALPSTSLLTGIAYNATKDRVPGAASTTAQELPIFAPGTP